MTPADLEPLAHAGLRQLPPLAAPLTLLPRVMSAVHAWRHRPWYARGWFTWPIPSQAGAVCVLVFLAWQGLILVSAALAAMSAGPSGTFLASAADDAARFVAMAAAIAEAVRHVARTVLSPVVALLFAWVALMWMACAALGAALNRVVLERT